MHISKSHFVSQLRDRLPQSKNDKGAAIVAAVGVMLICLSLGALVVSQAIMVNRDSGRDRARTSEVHTAEGVVDAVFKEMQLGNFSCEWPDSGTEPIGPDDVTAIAQIKYWDESGNEIDCDDVDNSTPVEALITSTSRNETPTLAGIEPVRTVEARVNLQKDRVLHEGAAIFSANGFIAPNNSTIKGDGADIWVDNGDFDCHNHVSTYGNIFVPGGSALMSNKCVAEKDLWARDHAKLQNSSKVHNNLYLKNGDLRLESPQTTIGGGFRIGGQWLDKKGSVLGAEKREEYPFTDFIEPSGFPEVYYRPSDWRGFQVLSNAQLETDVLKAGSNNTGACSSEWAGKKYIFPAQPKIINLECNLNLRGTEFVINADTVIFANDVVASNGYTVTSGDGEEHALWILVPFDTATPPSCGSAGKIQFNNKVDFDARVSVFLYAPCDVVLTNKTTLSGQVYGNKVELSNNTDLTYSGMGIPGVDLLPGHVNPEGMWRVDVVYKRETGDRVG